MICDVGDYVEHPAFPDVYWEIVDVVGDKAHLRLVGSPDVDKVIRWLRRGHLHREIALGTSDFTPPSNPLALLTLIATQ